MGLPTECWPDSSHLASERRIYAFFLDYFSFSSFLLLIEIKIKLIKSYNLCCLNVLVCCCTANQNSKIACTFSKIFQVPGSGYQVPGAQFPGVRCQVRGFRVSGPSCQVSGVRCLAPAVGCQVPGAGTR